MDKKIIDNLIRWIYLHVASEKQFINALEQCGVNKDTIDEYVKLLWR